MPSVAIYFFGNLSPRVTKKTGQDIHKENDWQLNCFYQFKSKCISGIIRFLFCMKVFSNLRFLNIDIDVVNNNESNRKPTPPFCCVSHSDLSPPGEAWLPSCNFRPCSDVSVSFRAIIQKNFEPGG